MSQKRAIVHIEIPAKQRLESAQFYKDLFGWDYVDMPEMNYTGFLTGSVGGGYNPLESPGAKVGEVLLYVETDDFEADLQKVIDLGGKVEIGKMEIPTVGWYAVFHDPTGNRMCLFQSMAPMEGSSS
ncbi:MAG: hypothetical protein Kow00124_29970 [Anaerolineae bacterium]